MEFRAVELIWLAVLILAEGSKKPRHSLHVLSMCQNDITLSTHLNIPKQCHYLDIRILWLWLCVGFCNIQTVCCYFVEAVAETVSLSPILSPSHPLTLRDSAGRITTTEINSILPGRI